MKLLIYLTSILISLMLSVSSVSQTYSIGEKVSFQSNILDEKRSILVYLPDSYNFTNTNYHVLYLLDGRTHFHHVTGITQFLSQSGLIPEMIVIGIVNTNRNKDFTPTKIPERPSSGEAEKFVNFLQEELFPFVERNYRINSYKILMGHSLGGTFATYSLLNHPELFNSYISVSPYLMYDNNSVAREADTKLKSEFPIGTTYYMTVGNEEKFFDALDYFANSVKTKSPKNLNFKYIQMLENDHTSVPHLSVYNGLLYIYSEWKLNMKTFNRGLRAIDNHFKKISEKYNYNIETPEFVINQLGYKYLGLKDRKNAISIFKENINRFPNSANTYDSLGEAYEKSGDTESAITYYQKAVNKATENKDPQLELFKQNLKRLKNKQ